MLEVSIAGTDRLPDADFSFSVGAGITAVVGPSGAGKTSLLRALAGLDEIISGNVRLDMSDRGIGPGVGQVGMVFQEARLLPHLSVEKNITLGRKGPIPASAIAGDLGIADKLAKSPRHLSGGERQRVMIARALFGAPGLMLLDEPLGAVDPILKQDLITLVRRQFSSAKIPVLYVTHDMEEAAMLADRMIAVEQARVISHGPIAEILARSATRDQFDRGIFTHLTGTVTATDHEFDLATVRVGQQDIEIAAGHLTPGDTVGLRLWSRDIILARAPLRNISARNQLRGRITHVEPVSSACCDILVDVAAGTISVRVMRKTVAELALARGDAIVVVFKSASIE